MCACPLSSVYTNCFKLHILLTGELLHLTIFLTGVDIYMSNLRKVIASAFNSDQTSRVADALISDVLKKYGVSENSLRNLSPEQKQKIKQIVAELQSKVNDTLK
jgi:spore coat protein W